MGLELLPVFWKNLVGLPLDPTTDLQEADIITYNYIKKFEMVNSKPIVRTSPCCLCHAGSVESETRAVFFCYKQAESEAELQVLMADAAPNFVHSDLNGDEVELIPNGRHVTVKSVSSFFW